MEIIMENIIELFIMPVGLVLIGLFIALVVKSNVTSRILVFICLGFLAVFSMPYMTMKLNQFVDIYPTLDLDKKQDAQVIVVLTAGIKYAPEFKTFVSSKNSLVRARYTDLISRITKLPILVSGGNSDKKIKKPSEAYIVSRAITFLGSHPKYLEEKSKNTYESAINTAKKLKELKMDKIILITNATHMKRSINEFKKQGITVIAAPCNKISTVTTWQRFLPSSLGQTTNILHEIIGLVWYKVKSFF
jgi:uncharacterized SAM-binding protein YcdF (DUF218 family)